MDPDKDPFFFASGTYSFMKTIIKEEDGMTVWTIAFGIFLGKLLWNMVSTIVNKISEKLEDKWDRENPDWREKHGKKSKPKEPIGFKQTTIES